MSELPASIVIDLPASPVEEAAERVVSRVDAPAEWRSRLAGLTLGVLLFETLSGLGIYLLDFSVFNQYSVLAHTVIGVAATVPIVWYVVRHWWRRRRGNLSHYQLLGYIAAAVLGVLLVSGFVLTWQAVFGPRIGQVWDQVHLIGTFVLFAALGAHLTTLVVRTPGQERVREALRRARWLCAAQSLGWTAAPLAVCAVLAALTPFDDGRRAFPGDYDFRLGEDRPFAPSLARLEMNDVEESVRTRVAGLLGGERGEFFLANLRPDPTQHQGLVGAAEKLCASMALNEGLRREVEGVLAESRSRFRERGALRSDVLAGSAGCGTSGCHSEIAREWAPSAHRYASSDFVFQRVQEVMSAELAPEATRYCAGCHDPISLFAGAKNVGNVRLSAEGADEGVSCLVCHSMVQADVRGNGDYTVAVPRPYLFEKRGGGAAKFVSDFLIRAYPQHHVSSYMRPLYKTAEACGACHKQFVDAELNEVGWVQGQNQYDSWRKSRWHDEQDQTRTISCRECHMPLLEGEEPAAGDAQDRNRRAADGKHRSHRFLGANQFIPRYLGLDGAQEQCELTVRWLRGEYAVPEIADRWTSGPVVRLRVQAPERVRPGENVVIQTVVTNNKAGHDFPTGPMDMIEGWVEVTVRDETGAIVFASARPDERGYLVNPRIVFKAELIDRLGQLIGRHELWRMVGARFKRALFPGFTDTTDFEFTCPGMPSAAAAKASLPESTKSEFTVPHGTAVRTLHVSAVVWYCKFSAPFLDRLFGEEAGMRSEVTDIARAEATMVVSDEQVAAAE